MKSLKSRLFILLTALMTAAVLASCGAERPESVTESIKSDTTDEQIENIITNSPETLIEAAIADPYAFDPNPFSSYTFSVSDSVNNYMITVSGGESTPYYSIVTEDSDFNYSEFKLTAPEHYALSVPFSQDQASSVCTVLRNTVDDTPVPDIIEFQFYLDDFGWQDETSYNLKKPYTVKKFYSVKDGNFTEIKVYDEYGEEMPYIPEYTLLRTEAETFMPTPEVTFDEDGTANIKVYVYDFYPDMLTLTKHEKDFSFENKLYYGYAAKAVADSISKYFTTTSLNVTDYETYVEVKSLNSSTDSSYFYYVDDPRFTTKADLEAFVRKYFDAKTTDEMFINAPQKYRDIDGKLCTIVGDAGMSYIGNVTITDYNYNEKQGTITYETKAERFDEQGRFVEFIDGGDFTLNVASDGSTFTITQYKLTY